MKDPRPINLNLWTIRFPHTAIVSILHRITGVVIFLSLPVLLCILQCSLKSAESFEHLQILLALPLNKFSVWLMLSAVLCHVLAGLRHLLMDMGVGESLKAARFSATLVLVLTIISMSGLGFLLW
jgi:succinate dehydrogenase / fumarate reductase cytochrome b subunit